MAGVARALSRQFWLQLSGVIAGWQSRLSFRARRVDENFDHAVHVGLVGWRW